jgi:hypothetical protein
MSWQVRLGSLDEEIEDFLDNNPDFPIRNKRELVKYAVRELMKDHVSNKNIDADELEKIVDKRVEEELN